MFKQWIERSKTYQEMVECCEEKAITISDELNNRQELLEDNEEVLCDLEREIQQLEEAVTKLQAENERLLASGAIPISEGNSSILFEIDKELNVTTKSRVNKEIVPVLIDNKYLDSPQSEDESAIQLVFVLLANEVTEQIISEINEDAN